jgi:hypothetical protein
MKKLLAKYIFGTDNFEKVVQRPSTLETKIWIQMWVHVLYNKIEAAVQISSALFLYSNFWW